MPGGGAKCRRFESSTDWYPLSVSTPHRQGRGDDGRMKLDDVHRLARERPSKFQVIVDDNYHYMDDDSRRHLGTFDT